MTSFYLYWWRNRIRKTKSSKNTRCIKYYLPMIHIAICHCHNWIEQWTSLLILIVNSCPVLSILNIVGSLLQHKCQTNHCTNAIAWIQLFNSVSSTNNIYSTSCILTTWFSLSYSFINKDRTRSTIISMNDTLIATLIYNSIIP